MKKLENKRDKMKSINHLIRIGVSICLLLLIGNTVKSQITVAGNQTANILAQSLVGSGVSISNPTLNCPSVANGTFVVTPPNISNLGLQSGIVLTSGAAQTLGATTGCNAVGGTYTTASGASGDADLTLAGGNNTFDACVLDFDFVPLGDTVKFDYVFGSCEYQSFTCTSFGDIFGFFISGPGITGPYSNGAVNIALVPGTSCPVGVNTINGSTQNPCGNVNAPCAPPNNALFVNNLGGPSVAYNGFTQVLQAIAIVQPCSTYHLKLAVSDASDGVLDTGVFLKEGSLSSNSITFTPISSLLLPDPYIVEGCASGFVKVRRPIAGPLPYVINYQLGGSATYPADYSVTTIPGGAPFGQVIIPANDTVAYIVLSANQDFINEPLEEIKIYQLAACSNNIVDSVSLFISDTIQMHIITPDTAICREDSVHILVYGSDSLSYTWTPTTNINNPNIKEPSVSPNTTTNYVVCATLPNSGCAPKCDTIAITINQPPNVFIGNDTIICRTMAIQFNPVITPSQAYTYTWGGSAIGSLSGTNISNPIGTFNVVGNYNLTLHVEPQALGCEGDDTIKIRILPDTLILHNGDTTVCKGATVPINVTGHPLFTYNWTPPTYLNNPFIEDPISNPDTVITYTVQASFPGCVIPPKSFDIDVQPVPIIDAGPDRFICNWDTAQLKINVDPNWYTNYAYSWSPFIDLNDGSIVNPVFTGHTSSNLEIIVTTPIGCSDTDNIFITVYPTEFATITPETKTICPNDSVQYSSIGGVNYVWTPNIYLNSATIPNPISKPDFPIDYTIYSTSAFGCQDTDVVRINVVSGAVLNAGEDITLYPGESIELNPTGNCSFYSWFPNYHLTNDKIKNPIADPPVTTQYFVKGVTEYGCEIEDSITIRISPETLLDLPNAFSPGAGTSINDELRIIKRGIATLKFFRIYNRWGQLVFETTDIYKGWNGRLNGAIQPLGVYVYVIDAITSTGKRFTKQGNVTLIR